MLDLLAIIIALPILSFLLLALFGNKMSRTLSAIIGSGFVGISALITILLGMSFLNNPPAEYQFTQHLWQWIDTAGLNVNISFYLDAISLVFIFVITFVGFLILLYSTEFMREEEGYSRFFAYMNLFIASMLILVLADNLLLLYLGWEGVGLCSYLLIGFWYKDSSNGFAARKAFIVTRIGDTAMAIGLFLLFLSFGTLQFQEVLSLAGQQWEPGNNLATWSAILLLGGAVGKSAQLPLQVWLPDAMAGPSPVSALIHAATMVTAGVYLIARTHVLFELAPAVQYAVAIIGGITLLLAGFSALTQKDIKRVLAYSTISQIGYMFLALGVGAWSAAVFHFMVHAFFKALLFLGAGALIMVLHHEHDMFKMGGLRKALPVTFWTFLIASGSLAAIPLVTAGFYSKDLILWKVFASPEGGTGLWLIGFAGAIITALYTFRMVFVTFFGEMKMQPEQSPGALIKLPLVILAFLSFAAGFIELPHTMGHFTAFSNFIHHSLPELALKENLVLGELALQIITGITTLIAVWLMYLLYVKKSSGLVKIKDGFSGGALYRYWQSGWGFDALYNALFVKPIVFLSKINKDDIIDQLPKGISQVALDFNALLSATQNGRLRWYMASVLLGAVIILTLVIAL